MAKSQRTRGNVKKAKAKRARRVSRSTAHPWPFAVDPAARGDAPASPEALLIGRQTALSFGWFRSDDDDQRGDDQRGDDQRGGDQRGGDQRGRDQRGGDQRGEDQRLNLSVTRRGRGLRSSDGMRRGVALGWHPDTPDHRDLTVRKKPAGNAAGQGNSLAETWNAARRAFAASRHGGHVKRALSQKRLPDRHENLRWCSPVENQGTIGSCTAHAVAGLIEFMQRRSNKGRYTDASRLFLYKVSRNLLGWSGDSGAYLRTTLKAAATFGAPPETLWPYDTAQFDREPSAFLYASARPYAALDYARLDDNGMSPDEVLTDVKRTLASGLGVAFGFTVYSSVSAAADIAFPSPTDSAQGGHAVMAVGYDDGHRLQDGALCPSLIIRNSWGRGWGIGGYGFLPYDYILQGVACDFWTILKQDWLPVG